LISLGSFRWYEKGRRPWKSIIGLPFSHFAPLFYFFNWLNWDHFTLVFITGQLIQPRCWIWAILPKTWLFRLHWNYLDPFLLTFVAHFKGHWGPFEKPYISLMFWSLILTILCFKWSLDLCLLTTILIWASWAEYHKLDWKTSP